MLIDILNNLKRFPNFFFRLLDIDIFNNISVCPHLNLIPGAVSLLITSLSCTVLLLKVYESFLEFLYEESVCVCACVCVFVIRLKLPGPSGTW